jgi:DNA-directed RNA polymerase subunit RPC12/RpoP
MGATSKPHAGLIMEKLAACKVSHEIWVPPQVTLGNSSPTTRVPRFGRRLGDVLTPADAHSPLLIYPVPGHWQPSIIHADPPDLRAVGWTLRRDASGLLDDLRKLANDRARGDDEKLLAKARAFAIRWGPLWICRSHIGCHWSHSVVMDRNPRACRWYPQEDPFEFVLVARQVQAVIDTAAALQKRLPIPTSLWQRLGVHDVEARLDSARSKRAELVREKKDAIKLARRGKTKFEAERYYDEDLNALDKQIRRFQPPEPGTEISSFLSRAMSATGGPRLIVQQDPNGTSFQFELLSGLGWVRAARFEVAQRLCGMDIGPHTGRIYQCDGCGGLFDRIGRQPQRGRKIYCPECGKSGNYKANKRQYARAKTRAWPALLISTPERS